MPPPSPAPLIPGHTHLFRSLHHCRHLGCHHCAHALQAGRRLRQHTGGRHHRLGQGCGRRRFVIAGRAPAGRPAVLRRFGTAGREGQQGARQLGGAWLSGVGVCQEGGLQGGAGLWAWVCPQLQGPTPHGHPLATRKHAALTRANPSASVMRRSASSWAAERAACRASSAAVRTSCTTRRASLAAWPAPGQSAGGPCDGSGAQGGVWVGSG